MIPVTKPFLPPQEEYQAYIKAIWERNWLTNNGPLVNELELNLKKYLDLKHLLYLTNGTLALQIALKALDIKGEVITTPFSYVATISSAVWEGCKPVFVDIDEHSLNINPELIEAHISSKTSAILATHVYGNPCDVQAIAEIARRYNLKIIYDGAHGFGVKYKQRSLFDYGDICTTSFHATKLFHTVEGGAVITKDPILLKKMAFMRNFGHDGPGAFEGVGINGKNSEFHAAIGLLNLKYIDHILAKRKADCRHYDLLLDKLEFQKLKIDPDTSYNFSYYPIIFDNEKQCLKILELLNRHGVYPRRYFYPVLSSLKYVNGKKMPIAEDISSRILCLPLYEQLTKSEIELVCRVVLRAVRYYFK